MRKHSNATDEDLFRLLKNSDESAFSALFNRYWDLLLEKAFYKMTSQTEAEEVAQQIFLDIWKNREKTELKFTFRTYISAALKYAIYAQIAKRRSDQVSIDSVSEDDFADYSTEQQLSFKEFREKLEHLINQLPEKCALVFRLSREKGLSNKEIAKELNISEKTVEAHVTKAIKSLKNGIGIFLIADFLDIMIRLK